jgi:hypothetical protein
MGASFPIVLNDEFNGSNIFALLTIFKKMALVNQSSFFYSDDYLLLNAASPKVRPRDKSTTGSIVKKHGTAPPCPGGALKRGARRAVIFMVRV